MADEQRKTEARLPDPALLVVSSSPHIHCGEDVRRIMVSVVAALIPAMGMSIYFFGLPAARVLLLCAAFCVACEWLSGRLLGRPDAWKDGSALVTGLLLAMNLSAGAPWWICAIGSAIAIVLAKQIYGGLGFNPFNPALVARIALLISFPQQLTTWVPTRFMSDSPLLGEAAKARLSGTPVVPFLDHSRVVDAVTCATPLGTVKVAMESGPEAVAKAVNAMATPAGLWDCAIGNIPGCLGETSAIAILAGGLLLIAFRVIRWEVPAIYIGTVAVLSALSCLLRGMPVLPGALFQILTGGLFLGAFFMATDMVTTPMTRLGNAVFALGCGVLTCVIRFWGAYPEGVMFSIVLMNAATPLIDKLTAGRPFGYRKPQPSAAAPTPDGGRK